MIKTLYGKQLADNTNYKLIKNAYNEGKLEIELFARDNMFQVLKSPNNRVTEVVEKEMARLFPGMKRI